MNRQKRTVVVVAVSVVMAAISAFAIFRAIQQMPSPQAQVLTAKVVVAAETIPVGTLLEERHLKTVDWPASSPVPDSVAEPKVLIARGVLVPIAPNEPVTLTKVAGPEAGGGLPPIIPAGMRAVSIRVNEVIGVAGFVVPGTRVDVVVTVNKNQGEGQDETMTRTVVSNVQVLTAGSRFDQEQSRKDGKPVQTSVVTLMVLPEDGERIALAQNEGKLNLALRNPLDVQPTATPGIKLASLMKAPNGQPVVDPVANKVVRKAPVARAVQPVPVAPVAPPPYRVETIRAAKRGEEEVGR
jgi:pilus assembly protein CpaB